MRRLNRLPLSEETLAFLQQRTDEVAKAGDMSPKFEQLWRLQNNKAFREVRRTLAEIAPGIERCMYCEDSKGTAIDHFWPKADYPSKAFFWLNYVLACSENIYGLDRATLVKGRLVTWIVLKSLLCSYAKHLAAGDAEEADRQKNTVRQLQFSGVFAAFLQIAHGPGARMLVGEEHLEILKDHPEISTWL